MENPMDTEGTNLFGGSEAGKLGGKARAASLSDERRREIARKAAESRWGSGPLPEATHTGEIKLGNVTIPCAVLADGRRLLTQQGVLRAIGRARSAKGGQGATGGVDRPPAFLAAKNLKRFIDKELKASTRAIRFKTSSGVSAFGYTADLLPEICSVYLAARDEEVLTDKQKRIATQCSILLRGLANVGITALVDEATGYQAIRARDELATILEKFVAREIQKWIRTFDIEFYEMICKLRGEPMERVTKRPLYFGRITNDLVYRRLAPGVLQELEKMNPADDRGVRRHKHFQGLTPEFGHPKLREHLAAVTTAMKFAFHAGMRWQEFRKMLNKTMPKWQPMPLFDKQTSEAPRVLPPGKGT